MKDNAQEWLTSLEHEPTHFYDQGHDNDDVVSFTHIFKEKFSTTKQKATWQKQFFEIKQGTDTVDTYISRFKMTQRKSRPKGSFPCFSDDPILYSRTAPGICYERPSC